MQTLPLSGEKQAADSASEAPTIVFHRDAMPLPFGEYATASSLPIDRPYEAAFFCAMARLGVHAAEALAYAHSQGVLHRDIKPSNLLVDAQGTLWVADFGLAKTDDSATLTEQSELVGTLRYLAPERFRGLCDARSDVYALGVTLYEMLTLQPAFAGEDRAELIERILQQTPPPLHLLAPKVPPDLETIVVKAMAKEPAERYASARELAGDLRCYLEDRPIQARRPTLRQKMARWSRRHKPIVWSAAVSAFVLLVMSVAVLAWSNLVISQERDRKEEALKEKEVALLTARQNELTARRRFYAGQISLAQRAWEAGNPARVLDLLEGLRPGAEEVDLRGFEWYYLWRLCRQGHRFRLKVPNSRAQCLAFSPDGKLLAAGCDNALVMLWEAATGRQQATWRGEDRMIPSLAFAPDGKTLVAPGLHESRKVTRWDLATGRAEDILNNSHGTNQSLAFSSDGKTLAAGSNDGTLTLWDTATWRELATLSAGAARVSCLAFSPDGRKLAAAIPWDPDNGKILIWDWASRTACVSIKHIGAYCIAFSGDGRKIAAGGDLGALRLYEAATGRLSASFHGHIGWIYSLAFAPDGKTLASAGNDRTVRLWDAGTRQQRICYADASPVYAVAFSPNGQTLASAGDEATIDFWDVAPARQELILPGGGAFVAFSPDGKTMASSGTKALKLWDVAAWKATELPFAGGADPTESLAFSHDGKTIAVARGRALKLFDVIPSRERVSHDGANVFWSVAFSPDDKTLASASYGPPGISLWDVATQQVRATLIPDPAASARVSAFSPDGATLTTGSQFGALKLFDLAAGRERATLQPSDRVRDWIFCVVFSPDGSLLASGDRRGIVKLWDAATGELRATLKGHTDAALALAFTSDGRTLATGSDDATVKLWDTATGQERMTLKGFKSAVRSLSFAPNDTLLAAGSWDGTVRIWRAAADAEARARRAN